MKKIISILVLTLIATVSNAQGVIQLSEASVNVKPVSYDFIEKDNSFSINLKENVQGEFEKNPIAFLEKNFNIHQLINQIGERGYESYNVTFKSRKGELNAEFDNSGDLRSTFLKFENVAVPKELQHKLYKDHKGWAMVKNVHIARGRNGKTLMDFYRITMKKGNESINLKINTADFSNRQVAYN